VSFLLDTDILSEHLRRPVGLAHRFIQHSGRLNTSSVSLAELYDWVNGRSDPAPIRAAVQSLLTYEVSVIPLDADCAEEFGRLRVALRRQGLNVDNIDLLIAATALVYDLTLVTHNTRHFQNIPNLRLDDWLTP
jgi:predicted nucleic acid-binding protein